ncbi:MAG: tRNA lysidine(34) synthetase TilS [Lentisphaerae bacterium]|nr:tRNA lysidine(34) synthetase TilS [Lentisphaerota bacterium]
MLRKIRQTLKQYRLLKPGDHVLVAVSGGPDSVALLRALHSEAAGLGITITVAHLDHRTRGRAGEEDAAFVIELARTLGTKAIVGRANVPRLASQKGVSLEMAARDARYRFLVRTARSVQATVIATGHNADDQAETVLLKLARGSGTRGMAGIPRLTSLRGYRVVRPLLDVTRREIIAYLDSQQQGWREDLSNKDPAFLRNRVRHEVLPFLETALNPSIRSALRRTAEVLGEEDQLLNDMAGNALDSCLLDGSRCSVDIAPLSVYPLAMRRRMLSIWLLRCGVAGESITFDLLKRVNEMTQRACPQRETPLPGGGTVIAAQGSLRVDTRDAGAHIASSPAARQALAVPGETLIPESGLRVTVSVGPGVHRPKRTRVGKLPADASLSCAVVGRKRVYVRAWRAGDRMRPLGLRGSKKLQDIFVDDKVPVDRRMSVPVFECGGEIVWIPGFRIAEGWAVTDPAGRAVHFHVARY